MLFVPQIERVTGRKIVDLFDWIIGTSTGALIALCLTYGTINVITSSPSISVSAYVYIHYMHITSQSYALNLTAVVSSFLKRKVLGRI